MSQSDKAEARFREAYERLKAGTPIVLEAGSEATQNNTAREAGKHPSALRRERFPDLVDEIQAYNKAKSSRQPSTTEDGTSRLKETIAELTAKQQLEASRVLSLLLELNDVKKELRDVSARANKITNIAK
jgi:gas vesicle protein